MTDKDPKKGKKRGKGKEVCGYPLSIFFIVVNEFCERFSYYGMRAVLVLYFKYFLLWDDDLATSIYHTFVALCYLTPILGAIVADSWLGKFKTIIYLSIVYALGQGAMAVSAIHDITDTDKNGTPDNMTFHVALSMVGLFLIALGTGGIKPCVAAFGGDQFGEHQDKQRRTFFSVFYLCINGGSLLSTIITPILRAQQCGIHTQQECYPLAFGVPAALMVVALVVFIVGSGMYYKAEPEGNIMLKVCKCIGFAIKNRCRHGSSTKKEHWMDWAEDKYDKLLIAQIKMVLKVLFLYIPLPMFWTLFDQKGSRWTLQATTMDGNFGALIVQPDQMQTFNPILILTLVPIMDSLIYPLIKKCGLNFSPLKRMTVGMFLAAMAFVCAAVVQLQIDQTLPVFPSTSQSQLKLLNMGNNKVTVTLPNHKPVELNAAKASEEYYTFENDQITVSTGSPTVTKSVPLTMSKRQTLLIPANLSDKWPLTYDLTSKPQKGNNAVRFINGMTQRVNVSIAGADFELIEPFSYTNYSLIKNGKTTIIIQRESQSCKFIREFGFGSSYGFLIPSTFTFAPECQTSIPEVEYIKPNSVHMALQIPQYFFITAGEVMFSVTGLEFSYSQAPSNMKAVLQAGWLLTVAVGNFIVLIVAEVAKLPQKWAEYLLFASLLVVVCIIFSIMAYFYTYIDPTEIEAQFRKKTDDDDKHKNTQKAGVEMKKKDSWQDRDEDDRGKQT
ncbi:solute carrier family 15 member 1 [Thalassophryne amazonica]|uniref:solute carrier family 15 member 1 n=1 Tax=Thalassophryne amazonica TaxID=390379 RepID=UPI0014708B15|nr:solute carrier family 15 member 1 [Thalassophryne amazonica]